MSRLIAIVAVALVLATSCGRVPVGSGAASPSPGQSTPSATAGESPTSASPSPSAGLDPTTIAAAQSVANAIYGPTGAGACVGNPPHPYATCPMTSALTATLENWQQNS